MAHDYPHADKQSAEFIYICKILLRSSSPVYSPLPVYSAVGLEQKEDCLVLTNATLGEKKRKMKPVM